MFRIDRRKARDMARVGLQTAAAVVVVYGVMSWYAIDHLSWAIISALFTIRLSTDSTLSVGVWRIVAALIGTAVGLAAVVVFQGSWQVLLALVTAAVVSNLITTLWPALYYVSVAAAIVALDADAEIATALERALAIVIGSTAGALASFVVWPELARSRALRSIAYALDDCRRLIETSLGGVVEDREQAPDTRAIDESFARHITNARQVAGNTRFRGRLTTGRSLGDGIIAIERLWHAVIVLDRAAEEHRDGMRRGVGRDFGLDAARAETASYLRDVVAHLQSERRQPPRLDRVSSCLERAEEALRRSPSETSLTDDIERERAVAALRFGVGELSRNLREIQDLVGPGPDAVEARVDRPGEGSGAPRSARTPASAEHAARS